MGMPLKNGVNVYLASYSNIYRADVYQIPGYWVFRINNTPAVEESQYDFYVEGQCDMWFGRYGEVHGTLIVANRNVDVSPRAMQWEGMKEALDNG